jgi:hypothetical protein
MSIQTADVLDAARDLVDTDGWRQGVRLARSTGLCAGEAIAVAEAAHDGPPCYMAARRALEAVVGGPHIEGWNDAPGRRVSEVLNAFTAAANRERGTG